MRYLLSELASGRASATCSEPLDARK